MRGARPYTTHDVATMFGVSITTVVRWIEAGLVVAYRTPGGHRRITRDQLHQFARQRGLGFLIGDGDAED